MLQPGVYGIRLLNYTGQLIFATQIIHKAGIAATPLELNKNIGEGLYRLEVISADGNKTTIPISILK